MSTNTTPQGRWSRAFLQASTSEVYGDPDVHPQREDYWGRPWVIQEWTSWMAGHGPLGRLLPVTIDAVDLPFILKATQAIDATHRDAQQTADALFKVVGDPATLSSDDARRLVLGRDLVFTLSRDDEQLTVVTPSGESRQAPLPWRKDKRFGIAHLGFSKLHREPVTEAAARTELFRHARTLGSSPVRRPVR